MVALLLCLCAVNIWDAAVVIKREYLYPYSGAEDAANYLKSVGADKRPMFGLVYGVVGVQAYFDRNIFVNMPTHLFPSWLALDRHDRWISASYIEFSRNMWSSTREIQSSILKKTVRLSRREGYELAHFSDGYYLYKRAVYARETLFHLSPCPPYFRANTTDIES